MMNNMISKYSQDDVQDYAQFLIDLRIQYDKHLAPLGVEWPSTTPVAGLVLLFLYLGRPVSKDVVAYYMREVLKRPDLSGDQQLRHLRAAGWYVNGSGRGPDLTNHLADGCRMPKSTYALLSVTSPHPLWLAKRRLTRTGGRLLAQSFLELRIFYGFKCAMCGTELTSGADQGHMDPRKPLTISNTIPLCTSCNNWQGDRVILDNNGRIYAILDPVFVTRAGEDVQEAVLDVLLHLKSKRIDKNL